MEGTSEATSLANTQKEIPTATYPASSHPVLLKDLQGQEFRDFPRQPILSLKAITLGISGIKPLDYFDTSLDV